MIKMHAVRKVSINNNVTPLKTLHVYKYTDIQKLLKQIKYSETCLILSPLGQNSVTLLSRTGGCFNKVTLCMQTHFGGY